MGILPLPLPLPPGLPGGAQFCLCWWGMQMWL
uniref:Uncharacterized protein n=1 Tax=Rhizophora mucronata TaxID=61149 RepID=A0A2P2QLV4_RHIMU